MNNRKIEIMSIIDEAVSFGVSRTSAAGEFSYFAGYPLVYPLSSVPDSFHVRHLNQQIYAIFTHEGSAGSIIDTKKMIWSTWLLEYGLTPLNELVGTHYPATIERFDNRFLD